MNTKEKRLRRKDKIQRGLTYDTYTAELHITIAETKSMNKAAEKLYVSQPSLTNAIKELEKNLVLRYFIEVARCTLTNDGRSFIVCQADIRTI